MAGKIIADTLEHSTAGSLDTQYVVNGSAKAWSESVTSGTQTVNDSLNVSSITDDGTGLSTLTWTNAFTSTAYTYALNRSGSNNAGNTFQMERAAQTSATLQFSTKYSDANSVNMGDTASASTIHTGDLA